MARMREEFAAENIEESEFWLEEMGMIDSMLGPLNCSGRVPLLPFLVVGGIGRISCWYPLARAYPWNRYPKSPWRKNKRYPYQFWTRLLLISPQVGLLAPSLGIYRKRVCHWRCMLFTLQRWWNHRWLFAVAFSVIFVVGFQLGPYPARSVL